MTFSAPLSSLGLPQAKEGRREKKDGGILPCSLSSSEVLACLSSSPLDILFTYLLSFVMDSQ